ncbi:hypothetical protein [Tychonema sp. BBK16]|uniref:hypothetical protein n=1 Tax=Tychonema sp. BBK16 TaxID=2699888 RepID=UPI001F424FF0|nr:hypothetical protein [Tychonema sp. BBK16]MCF6373246.1 hypothetical protein [Tychonema sp. BBK16]
MTRINADVRSRVGLWYFILLNREGAKDAKEEGRRKKENAIYVRSRVGFWW